MQDLGNLLRQFNLKPGATRDLVEKHEEELSLKLPEDYLSFLTLGNGGEGFIGQSYAILWGVEELGSANREYEIPQYTPGFLAFGSDGGGEAFGFDTRRSEWPVVRIPFIGLSWNEARPVGNTFSDFLENIYRLE